MRCMAPTTAPVAPSRQRSLAHRRQRIDTLKASNGAACMKTKSTACATTRRFDPLFGRRLGARNKQLNKSCAPPASAHGFATHNSNCAKLRELFQRRRRIRRCSRTPRDKKTRIDRRRGWLVWRDSLGARGGGKRASGLTSVQWRVPARRPRGRQPTWSRWCRPAARRRAAGSLRPATRRRRSCVRPAARPPRRPASAA